MINLFRFCPLSLTCLAGFLLVSGCVAFNNEYIFKPNTSLARKTADQDKCLIAAYKEVPQAKATYYTPGYYNPGFLSCNTYNRHVFCHRVGAYSIPASFSSYDKNSDVRKRYISSCMAKKGYISKILPRCTSKAESERVLNAKSAKEVTCRPYGA